MLLSASYYFEQFILYFVIVIAKVAYHNFLLYILLFIKKINKCHVKVRVRTLTDMDERDDDD